MYTCVCVCVYIYAISSLIQSYIDGFLGGFCILATVDIWVHISFQISVFIFFFFEDIYLFDRKKDSKRGNTSRGNGRGRSRLPAEQGAQRGA